MLANAPVWVVALSVVVLAAEAVPEVVPVVVAVATNSHSVLTEVKAFCRLVIYGEKRCGGLAR